MSRLKFKGRGLTRASGRREAEEDITVVCYDGEKTEADYFAGWRRRLGIQGVTLRPYLVKSGGNVLSAVEAAVEIRHQEADVENFWCVCDVDDSSRKSLNAARQLSHKHGIRLALSNRCFEIWLASHWKQISTAELGSEKEARALVAPHFAAFKRGVKTVPFENLYPLTADAMTNANWLRAQGHDNPTTDVRDLVTILVHKETGV